MKWNNTELFARAQLTLIQSQISLVVVEKVSVNMYATDDFRVESC